MIDEWVQNMRGESPYNLVSIMPTQLFNRVSHDAISVTPRTVGVYIVVAVFADNDVDYDSYCDDFDYCEDCDR